MNKKVGIVITVIVVILVCFFIGVIVVNSKAKEETNVTNESDNKAQEVADSKEEEKTESIVLNSKIGTEIQDLIYIYNIYSDTFFKEVEASGLDDRAKIMFTFAKMLTDDEYSSMLRQSADYVGTYITGDDLQKVANEIFVDGDNLKHQEVFLPNSYDDEKQNYIQLPTGFVEFSYIKDIPYKIEQKGNIITVYTYRLYIDCKTSDNLEDITNSTQTIYYDSNKTNKAIVVNNERMDDEAKQIDYINENINNGKIDKEKIKQGVYTILQKGSNYLIQDIK